MIEKNGRKSHRYEKKTIFDILGVVYECTRKSRTAAYKIEFKNEA